MLTYNTPFSGFDSWFDQLASTRQGSSSSNVRIDAYRRGDNVWVHADLPGVNADSIDIDVERNVMTITADRAWQASDGDQLYFRERQHGTYRRQLNLGEGLDADAIEADYQDGVLTLRIPVAERAKPRKIAVGTSSGDDTAAISTEALETSEA